MHCLDMYFPPLYSGTLLSKEFSAEELELTIQRCSWIITLEFIAAALSNPVLLKHFACTT